MCQAGSTSLQVERTVLKALAGPGAYKTKPKGDTGRLQSPAWGSHVHTSERLSLGPPHCSPSNREGGLNYGAITPSPKAVSCAPAQKMLEQTVAPLLQIGVKRWFLATWWLIQKHIFLRKLSRVNKVKTFSEGTGGKVLAPQRLLASLSSAQEGQDLMFYFQCVKYCLIISMIQTP